MPTLAQPLEHSDFAVLEEIHRSSGGTVFLGRHRPSGQRVVLKERRVSLFSSRRKKAQDKARSRARPRGRRSRQKRAGNYLAVRARLRAARWPSQSRHSHAAYLFTAVESGVPDMAPCERAVEASLYVSATNLGMTCASTEK